MAYSVNNKKSFQSRKDRCSAILAQLAEDDLKLLKVSLRKRNIPENPNAPPIVRSLDNPADLVLHREGEGRRPIFDRDDIVVNREEFLEERIVLHSPLHDRKHRSRSRSTSSKSSSSRSRSHSSPHSSKKKNRENDQGKEKNRRKSRSVDKTTDSGKNRDSFLHARVKTTKEAKLFKLEGIFKNTNRPHKLQDDLKDRKKTAEYDEKQKYRSRSRSPKAGSSKKIEPDRERYYRERDRDNKSVDREKQRQTPPNKYSGRSRSPFTKLRRSKSPRSRSPHHSSRHSNSPHRSYAKRYKSRSRSRSPTRKHCSRSPERHRDEKTYKRTSDRRSPIKKQREREKSPYRRRNTPHRDEKSYKFRKDGYRGRSSPPSSRTDRRKIDPNQEKSSTSDVDAFKEGYVIPSYGYMEGQQLWFPGPMPYPFGIRHPSGYIRPRSSFTRPFPSVPPYLRTPRFPMYNRFYRPPGPIRYTTVASEAIAPNYVPSSENPAVTTSSDLAQDTSSASSANINFGGTTVTNVTENKNPKDSNVDSTINSARRDSEDTNAEKEMKYTVKEPEN